MKEKKFLVGGSLYRDNGIDIHTTTSTVETNLAIDKRPDRVITSEANIAAGADVEIVQPLQGG